MPPGPLRVTNRPPGDRSRFTTAATSPSRPINDVDVTGSERALRRSDRRGTRLRSVRATAGTPEPLAQEQREVVTNEAPEFARCAERPVRVGSLRLELFDHRRQPRFPLGCRCLDVQKPRNRMGETELVLQARDVHARSDPAVPLPVQTDEDVRLGQVRPVQPARWVGSRPKPKSTGVSRSAEMARATAARSSASSASVELAKTRSR